MKEGKQTGAMTLLYRHMLARARPESRSSTRVGHLKGPSRQKQVGTFMARCWCKSKGRRVGRRAADDDDKACGRLPTAGDLIG